MLPNAYFKTRRSIFLYFCISTATFAVVMRAIVPTVRISKTHVVRLHVLAAASMKTTAFWDIAPCSFVEADRRFRGEDELP
jgi:hypothetical protein